MKNHRNIREISMNYRSLDSFLPSMQTIQPLGWRLAFHLLEDHEVCRAGTETAFLKDAVYVMSFSVNFEKEMFRFLDTHPVYEIEEVDVKISVDGL